MSFYFVSFSCTTQFHKLKFKSEYYLRINIGNRVKKCEHWQSHFDFLNNAYWVSFFMRNILLAKICFSQDPNFLLLCISFLYCIDLHPYSHDRFLNKSRPFCGSRNWWIIVVFFQRNSLTITIVSQKYWDLLKPYSNDPFSKISRTLYASRK